LLLPPALFGQTPSTVVGVDMDTTVIRIGEQTKIHLTLDHAPNVVRSVQWPSVADTLNTHVEVVHDAGVDTLTAEGAMIRHVRTLTITAFDTGFWAIPPFRFAVDGNTMETEALLLEVRSAELDSIPALRPIKDIHTLPFSYAYWFRQHWTWFAAGAAALAIIAAALYLMLRKRDPKLAPMHTTVQAPLHERCLKALADLDRQRLWQAGDHKGYHSRVTDIVRGYIEERFQVPALESTTDELLKELRVSALSTDHRTQLQNMLHLADQVKFAKHVPSPQENEQMMAAALRFVSGTALVPTLAHHA
jgi:hypothetical protein